MNSVAHREYALSGPTLVSVMPSAVEIVSLGGLPMGIEYEDLSARISMPRNRALANVLFRLELIEAYGTGIGRMRESYEGEGLSPEITVTTNTFSIVLPNRNAQDVKVAEAAGSLSTAGRILADLVSNGRVTRIGSGRGTRYRLP